MMDRPITNDDRARWAAILSIGQSPRMAEWIRQQEEEQRYRYSVPEWRERIEWLHTYYPLSWKQAYELAAAGLNNQQVSKAVRVYVAGQGTVAINEAIWLLQAGYPVDGLAALAQMMGQAALAGAGYGTSLASLAQTLFQPPAPPDTRAIQDKILEAAGIERPKARKHYAERLTAGFQGTKRKRGKR